MIPVRHAQCLGTLPEASSLRGNDLFFPTSCLIISLLRRITPKPETRSAPAAADGIVHRNVSI